jgi:hypothetical protein
MSKITLQLVECPDHGTKKLVTETPHGSGTTLAGDRCCGTRPHYRVLHEWTLDAEVALDVIDSDAWEPSE